MISTLDRQTAVDLINEAVVAGARHYKACCSLQISERTIRRWTKEGVVQSDKRPLVQRPEPPNKLSETERKAVLDACNSKDFSALPPSQIVPKLADQGRYLASESSFYRILRAEGQQHHRGRAKPPTKRKPPTSYQANAPCEVWTWDITWMPGPVAGMFFYLYLIVDIYSRNIVGWEVHDRESSEQASALIRKAVCQKVSSDNLLCCTLITTMEKLGITSSYSRPRVSNDNPFSEALFRTFKYRPNWPMKGFPTKTEAQNWVKSFANWYNDEHLHSAIRFVTPNARHSGADRKTLANRTILYASARARNPQRWSGKTRNWQPAGPVWLNPETENSTSEIRDAA